jgi:hypothetical protein
MKDRFVRCFTHFATVSPETSYDNFVRDFGERFVPDYHPQSAVDWVLNAPFKEQDRPYLMGSPQSQRRQM